MFDFRWSTRVTTLIIVLLVVSVGLVMTTYGLALAGSWTPGGAEVGMVSTNFEIVLGSKGISCEAFGGEGKLASASSKWSYAPEFAECESGTKSATVSSSKDWIANDVNSKEATLSIPGTGTKEPGTVIEFAATKCKIFLEEGVVGSANDYVDGKNGRTLPSTLTISKQAIPVKDSPTECFNSATKGTINANISLFNFTTEGEAIKIG